jgi:hypothetical protein
MGPMLRWFVFTIAFGLLPFAIGTLQRLLGGHTAGALHSPALLFFSVMVCAAQLSGILGTFADAHAVERKEREILSGFFAIFLFGAVVSAILYGTYVRHELNEPALRGSTSCSRPGVKLDGCTEWLNFRMNLFTLSIWVAAFFATMGTVAEWKRSPR